MFGRLLVPAALILAAANAAFAQVDEGAKARLQQSAEAIKAAEALKFKVKVSGTGSLPGMMPTSEGSVVMLRQKSQSGGTDVWLVHATGKGQGKAKEAVAEFDVAWLNGASRITDFGAKKVIQAAGKPRPVAGYKAAEPLRVNELVEAEPLKRAINSPNITLLDSAEVGGVACDVIETGAGKATKERYFISKEDNLPRKIVRVFDASMMSGEWAVEIDELTKPTGVTPESFEYPVPAGFTEEKFVPQTPAAHPTEGGRPEDRSAPTPSAAAPAPTHATEAAPAKNLAQDFELLDADGKKVSLASLRGNVVLLDFWGTWCIPCRASHKELAALSEEFKGKPVKIMSLAVREKSKDAPIEYMKKNSYTFGLLLDADSVAEQYKVKAYPTFVLIGQDGQLASRFEAFKKDETVPAIKRMITTLLEDKPATPAGRE